MARVFEKPILQGEVAAKLIAYTGMADSECMRYLAAGSSGYDAASQSGVAQESGGVATDRQRELDLFYALGVGTDLTRMRRVGQAFQHIMPCVLDGETPVVFGDRAQMLVLYAYLRGASGAVRDPKSNHLVSDARCREIAAMGMIASMATPSLAVQGAKDIAGFTRLVAQFPLAATALEVAETWRYGVSHGSTSNALRTVINGDPCDVLAMTSDDFRVTRGAWARSHPNETAHLWLDVLLWSFEGQVLVLDTSQRNEIADILRTVGRWMLYGMNYRPHDAPSAAWGVCAVTETFAYITEALRCRKTSGARFDTLAKQMKASYAWRMSRVEVNHGDTYEAELAGIQEVALEREACAVQGTENLWMEVIRMWPDDVAMDFGTAWNWLPAADAIPATQDKAMQAKMTAPRTSDKDTTAKFLAYSATVLSAHVLTGVQDAKVEWADAPENIEQMEWVMSCRTGVLSYPSDPAEWGPRIVSFLPWKRHLEWWHFTAQDVTHVFADLKLYTSVRAASEADRHDGRELAYVMKHGSRLSGQYTTEEVRASADLGKLVGDRVGLVSSKRENTKTAVPMDDSGKGATRETVSQDDVLRELLTELDRNASVVARKMDGISSRASRLTIERQTDKVLVKAANGGVILCLDVVGWSPNMIRELEMAFADIVVAMFKVAEGFRPSAMFKDTWFVTNKSGYHSAWKTDEGSVQGFFGTIDTMMHSMLMQFAVSLGRHEGKLSKGTTVAKTTLIDDIAAAIALGGTDARIVVEYICSVYLRVGPEPDIIKTLYGARRMHFLNRMYRVGHAKRQEVITAAKIFAKADREQERKFTTLSDRMLSAMGSASGAADRGANPIACYVLAIADCVRFAIMACGGSLKVNTNHSLVVAWLPVCLLGWGLPSFSQWSSRCASHGVDAGLGTISRLGRTLRACSPRLASVVGGILAKLMVATPELPTYVGLMDDPSGVTLEGCAWGGSVISNLLKQACDRRLEDPALLSLLRTSNGPDYEEVVKEFLRGSHMSAQVVAALAETMPHSVIRGLIVKAESNEALLPFTTLKERKHASVELKAANRAAATASKRFLAGCSLLELGEPIPTGAEVADALRQTMFERMGVQFDHATSPSCEDLLAHTTGLSEGLITVAMPATTGETCYTGIEGGTVIRTSESSPLLPINDLENMSYDPVTGAYCKMLQVAAVVSSAGGDGSNIAALWGKMWIGNEDIPWVEPVSEKGTNASRLAGRVKRRTHTVAALPNLISSVTVKASNLVAIVEESHTTVDLMALVYTLKCSAILDSALGSREAMLRTYSPRYLGMYASSGSAPVVHRTTGEVTPALTGREANELRATVENLVDSVHTDAQATIAGQGANLPEIGEGEGDERSALHVLTSIPYGTVAALILRSSVAGAGAGAEPQSRPLPAALRPDTAMRSTRLGASAAVDANTTIADARATVALKEAVALSLFLGPYPREISEEGRSRANCMVTRHGAALNRLGLSHDAHLIGTGTNDEAVSAAYRLHGTLMRGEVGGGHVGLWQTYAARYEETYENIDRPLRKRGRACSLAAIMRTWVVSRLRHEGWGGMWRRAVSHAMLAAGEFMAAGQLSGDEVKGCVNHVLLQNAAQIAMSDRHHAHAHAHCLMEAMDRREGDAREIAFGMADALIDAHTFYAFDWVAPAALQERLALYRDGEALALSNMAAHTVVEEDIVAPDDWADIVLDTTAVIGDVPALAVEGVDLDLWAAFCEAQGYIATLVPPGSNEDIDSEFRDYIAPPRLAHADTDQ